MNDPFSETALTIATVFGSVVLANTLGVSGLVAVAVAGLYFGNITVKHEAYMSLKVRTSVFNFWEIIAFLANSADLSLFRRKYECCKHRSKYRFDNFGIWRRIYSENNIYLSDFVSDQ